MGSRFEDTVMFVLSGLVGILLGVCLLSIPKKDPEPVTIVEVKYIYDDEARLVGFCNGKYLIRTEEDEFPKDSCMFIEPIVWEGQV